MTNKGLFKQGGTPHNKGRRVQYNGSTLVNGFYTDPARIKRQIELAHALGPTYSVGKPVAKY